MYIAQNESTLAGRSSPAFCTGRKLGEVEQAHLLRLLNEEPECPSRVLLEKVAQAQEPISITVRQTNRLRVRWELSRKKGRPRRAESAKPSASPGEVIEVTARLSLVGVHLFAIWMEQQEGFDYTLVLLKQKIEVYKKEHPDEDFSLLYHKEQTLLLRFQSLFFAPLFGPRKGDPRSFVLVERTESRVLVYWGTSRVKESLEAIEWPEVYQRRSEIQENSFKRIIDHGALNTNYGRKKIVGPDRHQQRAQEKIERALEGTQQKVENKENLVKVQQEKVSEPRYHFENTV